MSTTSEWLESEIEDLKRTRDEMRVQVHLAKAEVRDRWEETEKGLARLEQRVRRAGRVAEEPLHEGEADARRLIADLREGFRRVRAAL